MSTKHFYTNGIEDKKFYDTDDIPEGWYRGRTNSGKGTVGYMWINNGIERKYIPKDSIIPDGWVKGNLKFTNEHKQNLSKSLKGKRRTEEQCKRISESHKTEEYIEKINATRKEKYGVENFFQDKDILAKAQENAHSEEANKKKQQTCQSHFGVDYPMQSDAVKEKSRRTCFEKYGCEYSLQSDKVKEKSKQTCMRRYGVEHISQVEEVKEKIRQTNIEKYGVDNPWKSKDIQQKIVNTNIAIRGVAYPLQDQAVLDKQIATNLDRYNVMYNIQLPQSYIGSRKDSKPNREFAILLDNYSINYIREFPLEYYQYDFKVNDVLVEINPSATHNILWNPYTTHGIDPLYHYNKSSLAIKHGYRVIHIFDWDDKEKVIRQFLIDKPVIDDVEIVELSTKDTNDFLEQNHIQGKCTSQKVCLGLVHDNEIVSVMTFSQSKRNSYQWELLRYCSSHNVIDGTKKLFSYFTKKYNPESIIFYCDKSKFSGQVYIDLGFSLKLDGKPMKHWYNPKEKLSRIADNTLRQRGFDQLFNTNFSKSMSDEQLIIDRGYLPIYDCGQNTYIWLKDID